MRAPVCASFNNEVIRNSRRQERASSAPVSECMWAVRLSGTYSCLSLIKSLRCKRWYQEHLLVPLCQSVASGAQLGQPVQHWQTAQDAQPSHLKAGLQTRRESGDFGRVGAHLRGGAITETQGAGRVCNFGAVAELGRTGDAARSQKRRWWGEFGQCGRSGELLLSRPGMMCLL